MNEPTHLDLFSGIGGFALAAQWAGFRTIGFCEIDKYCQKVLAKNFMADTEYDGGIETEVAGQDHKAQQGSSTGAQLRGDEPSGIGSSRSSGFRRQIHRNIFDLDGRQFAGVDLITGGFPCQPFSVAGKRRGAADDRHLWPEMFRVINEARAAWVLGENVPGIIPMELDNVLSDLEGIGYATRAFVIPACAVDARHRRDRLWIVGRNLADSEQPGLEGYARNGDRSNEPGRQQAKAHGSTSATRLFIPDNSGCEHTSEMQARCGQSREGQPDNRAACSASRWLPEPDVGRVVARLSSRLDGNRLSEGTNEIVRALREGTNSETIQWPTRGLGRIQSKEVLLTELCEYAGSPKPLGNVSLESKETSQIIMRGVWFDGVSSCPSCRRRSEEQRSAQHPNLVRLLSQLLTCDCGSTWLDATGTPTEDRVNRLKGLGNAIVPQVAYEILRVIYNLCEKESCRVPVK